MCEHLGAALLLPADLQTMILECNLNEVGLLTPRDPCSISWAWLVLPHQQDQEQRKALTSRAFSGLSDTACVEARNGPPLLGSNLMPAASRSFTGAAHVHTMWSLLMGRIKPSLHHMVLSEICYLGYIFRSLLLLGMADSDACLSCRPTPGQVHA